MVAAGHAQALTPWALDARYAWQAVQSRVSTDFVHTPGHAGFLINELADSLAGLAATGSAITPAFPRPLPEAWTQLWQTGAMNLWLVPFGTLEGATAMHICIGGNADSLEQAGPPAVPATSLQQPDTLCRLPFTAAQANVQTIRDVLPHFFNRTGTGQRRAYLCQLTEQEIDVVTLQECRSRSGRWKLGHFLTWRSGADKQGQAGCEIWIRSTWLEGGNGLDDWVIVHSEPRLLIVRSRHLQPPVVVGSAHAPHADRPESEIRRFWGTMSQALRKLHPNSAVWIGLDANADFTHADPEGIAVGSRVGVHEPRVGEDKLLQLVGDFQLWAPATFDTIHAGATWTWQHASGLRKRLDHFLATTANCDVTCTQQYPALDILCGARDHMPLWAVGSITLPTQNHKPEVSRIPSATEMHDLALKLWRLQPSWAQIMHVSATQQLACLTESFTRARKHLPRKPHAVPTQPYLSQEAWQALQRLKRSRELKATCRRAALKAWTRVCFQAWRRGRHANGQVRLQIWRRYAQLAQLERRLKSLTTKLARRDKARHLHSLLSGAIGKWHSTGRPDQALLHLRWASRRAADRRRVAAAGGYDMQDALREQFRSQEAGTVVTRAQLQQHHDAWQAKPSVACPAAVPTLAQAEAICRRQKASKAPGPDGIRNGLWQSQPALAGRWVWLLQAKMALSGREPADFKDALACALYKKGPPHLPANYRSIVLLNGTAKLWHGHLRNTLGRRVVDAYQPLQLGGRPGMHVGYALAAFRAAIGLSQSAGRSILALFVDVQAAFYEVDRELLFGGSGDRRPQAETILPWIQQLLDEGALARLGVPGAEMALLQDCVTGSSWLLRGDSLPVLAARGSRPGDGLADVLFGAVMSCLIRELSRRLQNAGVGHGALQIALGEPVATVCPIAWADVACGCGECRRPSTSSPLHE